MHTHSGQLARWLGEEGVESVSHAMRNWYGPPIGLGGVPGAVFAHRGGDFTGPIRAGYEATGRDYALEVLKRLRRGFRRSCRPNGQLNAGFSSLSDLIYEVTTNAKRQECAFQKTGVTGVVNTTMSLWRVGVTPAAGAAGAAAPGGTVPTSASTGALSFTNAAGGDTTHITTAYGFSSVVNNTLLMYDRLFATAKTMSSSATEAVTGVPTRYTSTTSTDPDYCGGNFLFPECGTILSATAHNWTTCLYTNQGNTGSQTMPSSTGNSTNIANRLDLPAGQWFFPLAANDFGIKVLTQMQCSSNTVTGAIDFVIGHPLLWIPCPILGVPGVVDGINSAFGLTRVFDNACLAFLEILKPTVTATNYGGSVVMASG